MKILKILVSNSKRFRVYGIFMAVNFRKLQIDDETKLQIDDETLMKITN